MANSAGGPDWATILTAIVAVYAAVLSSIAFIMGMRGVKRRITVTLTWGLYGRPGEFVSPRQLIYTAANTGSVAVQVRSVALILPNNDRVVPTNYMGGPLPTTLEPGHSIDLMEDYNQMEQTLRNEGYIGELKVRAAFGDGTGKIFKSKPVAVTV